MSKVTLADVIAERHTDERGTCPVCGRDGVPVKTHADGCCFSCFMDPYWSIKRPRTIWEGLRELIGEPPKDVH